MSPTQRESEPVSGEASAPPGPHALREVSRLALKLGCVAFGGPAAHIAMLREEVVTRRGWMTEQHFLDLLGATNLIPGPNSTEMVIHIGHERAGLRGLIAAGALFILPAATLVALLAWVYSRFGSTPTAQGLLYGVKPVIVAVVAQALWGLLKTAVKGPLLGAVGVGVLALYLLGLNEILLLFGAGALVMLVRHFREQGAAPGVSALFPPLLLQAAAPAVAPVAASGAAFSLGTLFLTFLKIGSVLYGSGYVLLAFLRNDFVERLGWLTDQQLLDAVAVGQFTPGPLFTTATFVGFLVGGWPGAALATVGIFLPAFLFVAVLNPLIPKLRSSPRMAAFLDGVNVAAVGLMAAVAWELGRSAIFDPLTVGLALAAAVLLVRFKLNSAWLVLAGAVVGLVASRTGF